ncbi:MAG: hypothetical protein R2774_08165 [Saprospiraceae bacterium]
MECRSCHSDQKFSGTKQDCNQCHTDIHQNTVGQDCARCHTSETWIVKDVTLLHEMTSFPLMGVHAIMDCTACHTSENNTRFSPIGVRCVDCHRQDFINTQNPNHIINNFGEDCAACHSLTEKEWNTDIVDHSFFPLIKGHDIKDCAACHINDNFANTSAQCITCHSDDFASAQNPNHLSSGFSNACTGCHTIDPGWMPVIFTQHDNTYFPIYSGKHQGKWTECKECHIQEANFKIFSCITCHTNPETDNNHNGISGYSYTDNACIGCHPNGDADMAFDHNATQFPLTGAHKFVDCNQCHNVAFEGTSTLCIDCHTNDFNNSTNPNHKALAFSTDCIQCHTTEPGWAPATFADHNAYYPLNGAHAFIANDCVACHNNNYNQTPNTCVGCHKNDFDNTDNPNHAANQFSTDCTDCHGEVAWSPSTFNHDGMYFPIFSGKHFGQWNACVDCHTSVGDFKQFSCTGCHINPETDNNHQNIAGYSYQNDACLACHPTGDADATFDHNMTNFPLTGAHTMAECSQCHTSGFQGTSTQCVDCHRMDFNNSSNPNHTALGLSTDCIQCHTTEPGWGPATFADHNNYYPLFGAHASIASQCVQCHNGDYNNTPNTCIGCHRPDYNATSNPNHQQLLFPDDCTQCHSENTWVPSTFDHDGMYFPIYTGKHRGEWNECMDCHTTQGNWAQFSCIGCHSNPETDVEHDDVGGYIYASNACLACHPSGDANVIFDHNTTGFALMGGHSGVDCIACHASGFQSMSSACVDCHQTNFDQSSNPNHQQLGLSTDCTQCHTTSPGWSPATFNNHNTFYALNGAHASIASDCAACHNGNYTNTPTTCVSCHQSDFNNTTDPNHQILQFPTECAQCHTESAWQPSTFNHDGQYFPIYSGKHQGEWTQCMDCHNVASDYSQFTCLGCHQNPETNNDHNGIPGYIYESNACLACHPTGDDDIIFDHNMTGFPLTGAHITANCTSCHSGGFQNISPICMDCHMSDFNQSTNPNHQQIGISTDCLQCHSTTPGWSPASFANHNDYYVITGAHTAIASDCAACHNGNYSTTPNTCIGCHQSDFNNTTNPNHSSQMFPTDCTSCHSQNAWTPTSFDHAIFWPLTGSHAAIANDCVSCHNGSYNNTSPECVSCHQNDFSGTSNPNHGGLGFSSQCQTCHTTNPGWQPATLPNHNDYYVIAGAHTAIANDCAACHNGNYSTTPNTCIGCHQSDFNGTSDPDHEASLFPTDCTACHSQIAWTPSNFDHNSVYPLLGAHAAIANNCASCHIAGNYSTTPNTCVGCHQSDFNNSSNPNHGSLGISTDCIECHTTDSGWAPALFPNHDNYFAIVGAHVGLDCVTCHNNDYNNTSNTCIGCHQIDYNNTSDPDHQTAMFPADCTSCHSQNGWVPSTFDHDNMYFPIYSGKHDNEWNLCSDCHTNSGDYGVFSCLNCHEHNNQNQVDDDHDGVSGYQYNSNACYSCHPNGED